MTCIRNAFRNGQFFFIDLIELVDVCRVACRAWSDFDEKFAERVFDQRSTLGSPSIFRLTRVLFGSDGEIDRNSNESGWPVIAIGPAMLNPSKPRL